MTALEYTLSGELQEHVFGPEGYDVWGYDADGNYNPTWDRAPFQRSPFATEHTEALRQEGKTP